MSEVTIRPWRDDDLDALLRINTDAVPAVNLIPASELARLVSLSTVTLVADDGAPGGFVILLPPGQPYDSENYRWFSARADAAGSSFLYVDRVAVAERLRDRGVGSLLYAGVFEAARAAGVAEVTAEVNLRPPNPGSLRWHLRQGFVQVGTQLTKGDSVEVALLAAPV